MFVGPLEIGSIDDWVPSPGPVVSWRPSSASLEKAAQAPISAVPPSYMQAQHIRGFCDQAAQGLDYSRLMVIACDLPGQCDIRAMTYAINGHLRRHDTYRSWFAYHDGEHIVRRTMDDSADIEVVPTEHGTMTPTEFRNHLLATPGPLQWDCFTFGLTQGADRFTFYVCIDHLHTDAVMVGVVLVEFYLMYAALVSGAAPIALPESGSYDEYCLRQRRYTSALSVDSPLVRAWIEFAENNGASLPDFPLPLGDPSVPSTGELVTLPMLDKQQTARFESVCVDAGARFIGGVLACAALLECELTGSATYYGLTPVDTRTTSEEHATMGWFTGLIPITVPVASASGELASFGDAARAAQASFDAGRELANVPFDRVLELAPWLNRPRPLFPVVNFLDAGVPPLSAFLVAELSGMRIGIYSDGRFSYQLCIWVNRLDQETSVTFLLPGNPVARESVGRYVAALKSVYLRVSEGRDAATPLRSVAQS